MMIKPRWIAALAALAPVSPVWASDPANDFVTRLNASIEHARPAGSDGARELCRDVARWAIDLDAAAAVVSAGAWGRMEGGERDVYRAALERRLVGQCARQAATAFGKPVELVGVRSGETGDMTLATRPIGEPLTHPLIWRGYVGPSGAFRATDVLVDGRSAVLTARDEAAGELARDAGGAPLRSLDR